MGKDEPVPHARDVPKPADAHIDIPSEIASSPKPSPVKTPTGQSRKPPEKKQVATDDVPSSEANAVVPIAPARKQRTPVKVTSPPPPLPEEEKKLSEQEEHVPNEPERHARKPPVKERIMTTIANFTNARHGYAPLENEPLFIQAPKHVKPVEHKEVEVVTENLYYLHRSIMAVSFVALSAVVLAVYAIVVLSAIKSPIPEVTSGSWTLQAVEGKLQWVPVVVAEDFVEGVTLRRGDQHAALGFAGDNVHLSAYDDAALILGTNGTERLRVAANGSVWLQSLLHVVELRVWDEIVALRATIEQLTVKGGLSSKHLTTGALNATGLLNASGGVDTSTLHVQEAVVDQGASVGGVLKAHGGIETPTVFTGALSASGLVNASGGVDASTLYAQEAVVDQGASVGGVLKANGGIETSSIFAATSNVSNASILDTLNVVGKIQASRLEAVEAFATNATISNLLQVMGEIQAARVTSPDAQLSNATILDLLNVVGEIEAAGITAGTLTVSGPVVLASGTSTEIAGSLHVGGNVLTDGNFTVLGSTFSLQVQEVQVTDNVITLNSGETGHKVTRGFAGVEVDRGSGIWFHFHFDEAHGDFRIGQNDSMQAVATRQDNPIDGGVSYWDATSWSFLTNVALVFTGDALLTPRLIVGANAGTSTALNLAIGNANTGFEKSATGDLDVYVNGGKIASFKEDRVWLHNAQIGTAGVLYWFPLDYGVSKIGYAAYQNTGWDQLWMSTYASWEVGGPTSLQISKTGNLRVVVSQYDHAADGQNNPVPFTNRSTTLDVLLGDVGWWQDGTIPFWDPTNGRLAYSDGFQHADSTLKCANPVIFSNKLAVGTTSTPTISLAIGNANTGFETLTPGVLDVHANGAKVASFDKDGGWIANAQIGSEVLYWFPLAYGTSRIGYSAYASKGWDKIWMNTYGNDIQGGPTSLQISKGGNLRIIVSRYDIAGDGLNTPVPDSNRSTTLDVLLADVGSWQAGTIPLWDTTNGRLAYSDGFQYADSTLKCANPVIFSNKLAVGTSSTPVISLAVGHASSGLHDAGNGDFNLVHQGTTKLGVSAAGITVSGTATFNGDTTMNGANLAKLLTIGTFNHLNDANTLAYGTSKICATVNNGDYWDQLWMSTWSDYSAGSPSSIQISKLYTMRLRITRYKMVWGSNAPMPLKNVSESRDILTTPDMTSWADGSVPFYETGSMSMKTTSNLVYDKAKETLKVNMATTDALQVGSTGDIELSTDEADIGRSTPTSLFRVTGTLLSKIGVFFDFTLTPWFWAWHIVAWKFTPTILGFNALTLSATGMQITPTFTETIVTDLEATNPQQVGRVMVAVSIAPTMAGAGEHTSLRVVEPVQTATVNATGTFMEFPSSSRAIAASGVSSFDKLFVGSGAGTGIPTVTLAIGDSDTGLNWHSDGILQFKANGQPVMAIDYDKRVSIPGKAKVVGSLAIGFDDDAAITLAVGAKNTGLHYPDLNALDVYVNNDVKMQFRSSYTWAKGPFAIDITSGTPTINLPIGDADTGINWAAEGKIQIMADNNVMIDIDHSLTNNNVNIYGRVSAQDFSMGTGNFYDTTQNHMIGQRQVRAGLWGTETDILWFNTWSDSSVGFPTAITINKKKLAASLHLWDYYATSPDLPSLNDNKTTAHFLLRDTSAWTDGQLAYYDSATGLMKPSLARFDGINVVSGGPLIQNSNAVENAYISTYASFRGKVFASSGSYHGSAPTISLAIGDTDTGFDWVSDGIFQLKTNNAIVARFDYAGNNRASTFYGTVTHDNTVTFNSAVTMSSTLTVSSSVTVTSGVTVNILKVEATGTTNFGTCDTNHHGTIAVKRSGGYGFMGVCLETGGNYGWHIIAPVPTV